MYGANLSDLDSLIREFETRAADVAGLHHSLTARIDPAVTVWRGPGADRFRGSWNAEFRPALHRIEEELRRAAGSVRAYRANIEAATR